ncbi:hypothetical protein GCM10023169_23370 [Georgenia halophila]|uniref:Secreted protein n=1 Tax=Georgenia halophila TaxID=620889 RepID=A0ABP8LBW2_9MICO
MTFSRAARRPVAALAAALTAVVGCLAGPAAAAPDEPEAARGLEVEITDMFPSVLSPGETLTVSGTVVNRSDQDAPAPELQLNMQRYTPISRTSLRQWMDPQSYSITTPLAVEELDAVAPGATEAFSVEVAPEDLRLPESYYAWGPHGVEVAVSDTGGTTLAGVDRSVALWYPDVDAQATPMSVLVPVTASAQERIEASANPGEGAVADAAAPRLLGLLSAVDQPGVTTAVESEFLLRSEETGGEEETTEESTEGESIEGGTDEESTGEEETPAGEEETPAGEEETPTDAETTEQPTGEDTGETTDEADETPESTGANDLGEALNDLNLETDRQVAVLPRDDADIAALAHTDATERLANVMEESAAAADDAGIVGAEVLAWPATQTPDTQTVAAAARAGATTAVLPFSSVTPLEQLTYTPTGRADLDVGEDRLPAVLVDRGASSVLAGRLPPVPGTEDRSTELNPLDTRQLLLAESAVINRERPNDQRAITLALPRAYRGNTAALADAISGLMSAPWVQPTTLSEVRDLAAPELDRDSLPERVVADTELTRAQLANMDAELDRARDYASVTEEPEVVLDPVAAHISSALSAAWRRDTEARGELLEGVRERVAKLDSQLVALESSPVNVINSSAELPVHVRNDLPSEVTVGVALDPSDDRLQVDGPVSVTVPASSQATVEVPVRAVGSGNVTAAVQLLDADGEPVGTPSELQVRVRADWESVGTTVAAVVLGLMLVIGLTRTVRRGRRMKPAAPEEVQA